MRFTMNGSHSSRHTRRTLEGSHGRVSRSGVRALAALVLAGSLALTTGCGEGSSAPSDAPGKQLTVGIGVDAAYTPWLVGVEKGFFEKNGIQLETKTFQDGAVAFDAMLTGDVDLAGPGQFPPIPARAKGGKVVLTGVYATSGFQFGAAGQDSIQRPTDLYGATIGVPKGTSAEYWLDRYAEYHQLDTSKLVTKNVAPPDLVAAMSRGDIDAFFAFDPHVSRAASSLDGVKVLARGSDNDVFFVKAFVAMSEQLAQDADTAAAVMKAMTEAGAWARENPDEAANITAQAFNIEPDAAREAIDNFDYDVYFDDATAKEMRDIASWMKGKGLIDTLPGFDAFLQPEPLKRVAPDKVAL